MHESKGQHIGKALRPMTVVFGLGTRLCVRMCTTFENGVLCNGQQPASAVKNFINQGEFGRAHSVSINRVAFSLFRNSLLSLWEYLSLYLAVAFSLFWSTFLSI